MKLVFSVSFQPPISDGSGVLNPVAQELSNDYEHLVMDACRTLHEAGGARFHIGGFGSDEWPVDVAYDLSAFMEQFPPLLVGVRSRREVEVDLYSQGIERTLVFRPVDRLVVIRCDSRTDWVPNPQHESLMQNDLVLMLSKLAKDFARGLKAVNSGLSEVAPFADWLKGRV